MSETNEPELLPCPFCGREPVFNTYPDQRKSVFCTSCMTETLVGPKTHVTEAWNSRVPAAVPQWTNVTPKELGWYLCKLPYLTRPVPVEIFKSVDGYDCVRGVGNVQLLHGFSGDIKNGQHVVNCLNLWLKLDVPPLPERKESTK